MFISTSVLFVGVLTVQAQQKQGHSMPACDEMLNQSQTSLTLEGNITLIVTAYYCHCHNIVIIIGIQNNG